MPDFTEQQVAEVAGKLTKGQRLAIIDAHHLDARAYGIEHWEIRGRSANSLSLRGLARGREIRSFTGRSRKGIVLTPLGLAVRAHLDRSPTTEGQEG